MATGPTSLAIVLDTGILFASYDRSDRWHRASVSLLERHSGILVVPAPVIPEVDHPLGRRLSSQAQYSFYRGLTDGSFLVTDLPAGGYVRVPQLTELFADIGLGFVDAAVLAISEHLGVRSIASADRRHFGPLQKPLGFQLLPEAEP